MKSVLLYANQDGGFESRLQAALDLIRARQGHLTCLQVTPFDAFVMGDPFGGVYALPTVIDQIRKTDEAHRAAVEERLGREGVAWDWLHHDGSPAQMLADRSRLADVIVVSLPAHERDRAKEAPLSIAGDVAVHARAPVLAMPPQSRGFDPNGPALVAWNGSAEAAHALRLTLPLLAGAKAVHIVTVSDDKTEFPPLDACQYLARHGVESDLREWRREGRSTAETLLEAAASLNVGAVVMGAYGHTRMRERVLGGATREMLEKSRIPLLLAH